MRNKSFDKSKWSGIELNCSITKGKQRVCVKRKCPKLGRKDHSDKTSRSEISKMSLCLVLPQIITICDGKADGSFTLCKDTER